MGDITIKEVNQLVPSDGEDFDYFGVSVALSGDGLVAIIGSDYNNTKAHKAGKVYTYSRTTIDDEWVEVNQLVASDSRTEGYFGRSVAVSSDGLVAIIGGYTNSAECADTDTGVVYTYSRTTINNDWVEVNQLTASNSEPDDHFGSSVALSGDGLVAIVGGYGNDAKMPFVGKVYTYSRDTINDDWTEVSKLTASDKGYYQFFGAAVALSNNGLVAMVGSPCNDTGKVYTYNRPTINDNWVESNQLIASDGQANNYFGASVALNSNGLLAIIGVPGSDNLAIDAGKVHTYSRATINDDWTEVNMLTASNIKSYDNFGKALAISRDGLVVIVGSNHNDHKVKDIGGIYTYTIYNKDKDTNTLYSNFSK